MPVIRLIAVSACVCGILAMGLVWAATAPAQQDAASTATPAAAEPSSGDSTAAHRDPLGLKFTRDYLPGTRDPGGQWMGGSETMCLLAHGGKLFAGLGYWMDQPYAKPKGDEPWTGAQVLVKESASGPWRVDVTFGPQYLRTESLASITLTTDAGGARLATPVTLLVAGPSDWINPDTRMATAWIRDDTTGRWTRTDIAPEPNHAGVRSFGSHVDKVTGIHHLFAGISHGQIYRGSYDPAAPGRVRWHAEAELSGVGRPMAMTETGGTLYAACGIKDDTPNSGGLFRRIDSPQPRWEVVYRWPYHIAEKGDETVLLRGLTPVPESEGGGHTVLLGTRAFRGAIDRIDPTQGHAATVELQIRPFFAKAWGLETYGGPCLSAYNRILPATHPLTGEKIHLIGVWVNHPDPTLPPHNGAYYLVRRAAGTYEWGEVYDPEHPVPSGSGLFGTRSIEVSPFAEDEGKVFYFGGHDCASRPSHNTAWIYRAAATAGPPHVKM